MSLPAQRPTESVALGSVIAHRYRVDAVLAAGGMGVVYRGFHLALKRQVAIKVLRPEFKGNHDATSRFFNEAAVLSSLRSPSVARVLDAGYVQDGPPYMVLEHLAGQDLRSVLSDQGALTVERAAGHIHAACEAVSEIHAAGIVHRDLKPGNLFLTRLGDGRDRLQIIDFGICLNLREPARQLRCNPGQTLGSPDYMAPEQILTPDAVDVRADVWSLGVVLFELLANALPFNGETASATCEKVLTGEPHELSQFRADLSPVMLATVGRCLRKDPSERFATTEDLGRALETVLLEAGMADAPPCSGTRERRTLAPTLVEAQRPQQETLTLVSETQEVPRMSRIAQRNARPVATSHHSRAGGA